MIDRTTGTLTRLGARAIGLMLSMVCAIALISCSDSSDGRSSGTTPKGMRLCVHNSSGTEFSLTLDEPVAVGMGITERLVPDAISCADQPDEQAASLITPRGVRVRVQTWSNFGSSGINIAGVGWSSGDVYSEPDESGSQMLPSGERVTWMHLPDTEFREYEVTVHAN